MSSMPVESLRGVRKMDELTDNRPPVYRDGETWVYRASSLGNCIRGLVAARRGVKPMPVPEVAQTRMDEGKLHERAILEGLERDGWKVLDPQKEVELRIRPGVVVRGHIECWLIDPEGNLLLPEIKSRSKDQYKLWMSKGWSAFFGFALQYSAYWYATGATDGLLAVKNRDDGEVDWSRVTEPPFELDHVKNRVLEIERLADLPELPSCGGEAQWNCSYYHIHEAPEEKEQVESEDLELLCENERQVTAEIKRLEEQQREMRDEIAGLIGEGKKRAGRFEIAVSQYRPKRFNKDKLGREYPELVERYTEEGKLTTRVQVKEVGDSRGVSGQT